MSAHAHDLSSPGFNWSADELPFFWATAYSLLVAVRMALESASRDTGLAGPTETIDGFVERLESAEQALQRIPEHPEGERSLPRYEALAELEQLLQLRGAPGAVDEIAREVMGSPDDAPSGSLVDALHAVSYVAEWAVAGLREQVNNQ